jgi:hypothetical protein
VHISPARTRRRLVATLGALALVAALCAWATAQAQAYVFRMSVSGARTGRTIQPGYLGLALEYNEIPELAGATPRSVDPVFAQLLRNLDPQGNAILRIGGQSTDRSWWPVPGMAQPLGVTYKLGPAWAASARSLAQATGAKLILGINLESDSTRLAREEGAQLLKSVGQQNIAAWEIGNEPDLYTLVPWYKRLRGDPLPWYDAAGTSVFSRPTNYAPSDFIGEFSRTVVVLPRLPVAGPGTGSPPWMDAFDRILSPKSQLRMLTAHAYGLNQCVTNPKLPAYPSVPNLVSTAASRSILSDVAPYVPVAHRNGATLRVDEMGSVSCNGRAGVSNTMASALWVMDALFQMAADGVDGVNLHTYPHLVNDLFDFAQSHGQWRGTVKPLYYGALMFAQAAPAGSSLLRIASGSQTDLRAWATVGPDHRIRVLLINDSLRQSADAVVRIAGSAGPAAVERLQAPSAWATGGVTLGGRSFGAATSTGVLAAPVPQTIMPHGGAYGVSLSAGSAALLTLPPAA